MPESSNPNQDVRLKPDTTADAWGRAQRLLMRSRRALSITAQMAIVIFSNWLAFQLRFDSDVPPWALAGFWQMLPWLVAFRGFLFFPFRLYEGLWRYTSIYDLRALIGGVLSSSVAAFVFAQTPIGPNYPRSVFIIDAILLLLLLGGIRLTRRLVAEFGRIHPGKRVLIVGAGDAGELIVRDMKSTPGHQYYPLGFVDDDQGKVGLRIHGVPVLGTRRDLPVIVERYKPAEVLIAIPAAKPAFVRSVVRSLEPFKIPIKTLPNLRDILQGKVEVSQIRNLAVDDLLTRAPVGLDRRPLHRLIEGRRVLVTGAGGSIGSELCRQIARLRPAALIMVERYENTLHEIRMELEDRKLHVGLFAVVADITDQQRVSEVLERYYPEIIFHAAAHKHVPLMEENPCEAIKNNVRGTRLLARAAEEFGVDRFILISTDKAVNPTSVMGASKRLAELAVQAQAVGSGTSYSTVRFGNVLGSNGSVVPRFLQQIQAGGPVTVTHPEIRRFFMLIPEAVQLVLHAASQAESGATYVLEMGEQVKVADLARHLIRLSGLVPDEDIKIEYVGLRPGEKLFEELANSDEEVSPSNVEKILCVRGRTAPSLDFLLKLDRVETEAAQGRRHSMLEMMNELVAIGPPGDAPAPDPAIDAVVEISPSRAFSAEEQPCPRCKTGRVHRSHVRTWMERTRKEFTARRPFRCRACGWRGWLMPMEFGLAATPGPDEITAPELSTLDAEATTQAPAGRVFSPRDVA